MGGVAAIAVAQAPAPAQVPASPFPAGTGHDTFVAVCSACHSPEVVLDKKLNYEGWDFLVRTMIDRGGVATDKEVNEIVDYLAKNYPPAG
jgi:mono/diheme cytochrome c family protein